MRRALILAAGLALSACGTTAAVTGDTALSGQELDSAVGLYGPWEDYLVLEGKPTYVWRRVYTVEDKQYYCELRVEMGFRRIISRSVMQGYPQACELFSVRYQSNLR